MITVDDVCAQRESMLRTLEQVVNLESPSHEKAALDRLGDYLRQRCDELGGQVERLRQDEHGDLTVARWSGTRDGDPVLVMTHIDTVWPLGTLERKPFVVDGDIARGPGVYDMKASVP